MKILVVGPASSYGGYGAVARTFIDGFIKLGKDVKIQTFSDYKDNYDLGPRRLLEYTQRNVKYANPEEWRPDVVLSCMSMGYKRMQPGIKHVITTGFEGTKLHPNTTSTLDNADVVTLWSKEQKSLYEPYHDDVRVVPLGVDTEIFKPMEMPRDASTFRFIANGKWEYRKNFTNLVKAFSEVFKDKPNVSLMLKLTPFNADMEEISHIISKANKHNAQVHVAFEEMSEFDLARLYNQHDVYVHASRSEGFGVPMLEAMACGLPLITSKEGGHREFVDEEVSLLVKGKVKPVIPHSAYGWGSTMFEPSFEDYKKKLQYAYTHRDEMKKMGEKARERALQYDNVNVAKKMLEVFESIKEE